jgi:hypothetical protein
MKNIITGVRLRQRGSYNGSVYSSGLLLRKQRLKPWNAGDSFPEGEPSGFDVRRIEGVGSD